MDAIRKLKASAPSDLSLGSPDLAAHAIRAGLVDEYHVLLAPITVGGGNPLSARNVRAQLELLGEHRSGNGMVYMRYGAKG